MDPIFERVSIRRFLDKPVEREKVEKLMRAAMQAPSSTNQQDWEFIVVTDKALCESLSKVSAGGPPPKPRPGHEPPPGPPPGGMGGGPSIHCKDAPLCIVCLGNTDRMNCPENWEQDLGAATQNILLEAVQLGLGGVWMSVVGLKYREDNMRELFNLPDNILPYCILAIGYPAETPHKQEDRYHPEYVHYNGF